MRFKAKIRVRGSLLSVSKEGRKKQVTNWNDTVTYSEIEFTLRLYKFTGNRKSLLWYIS